MSPGGLSPGGLSPGGLSPGGLSPGGAEDGLPTGGKRRDLRPFTVRGDDANLDVVVPTLLWLVAVVLLVAGPTMIVRGLAGREQIKRELAEQRIVFPSGDGLPAALMQYAGARVRTGEQAKAFSEMIGTTVTKITNGRTYSEIGDELTAAGGRDEKLTRLQETAFKGQMLRGSLLGAYQAWQLTLMVIGLGALFLVIGLAFLALAATWQ